jgi:hypothetical protein
MKLLILAAALLSPIAAHAASPEDAYIAARDAAIAAFQKTADTKAVEARNKQHDKVQKELERKLKAIVGPFAMRGFPAEGKINLDTLFSEDEGFGMLDGIVYGETESDRSVVVTTDGLLRKWLEAHGDRTKGQTNPPVDPAAATQTELFYSQAISTDAAVVGYADIPLAKPDSAKFVAAMLASRTQDLSPPAPDHLFVALARGGRVFIVDEKLDKAMGPIAECDEVTKIAQKKADEADRAYAASDPKDEKLADVGSKLRNDGDEAFRRCYGEKVKPLPMFKTASDQARAILDALPAK